MSNHDQKLEVHWEARLRRLGLSMNRGNPRSKLTYVSPQRLAKIIEQRQTKGFKVDPFD